ncbi:MAG: hypothetical protein M3384_05950 [Acidobacteriota bacterium]|nr:hypothetical protein [Acidobacteriota bacterium]
MEEVKTSPGESRIVKVQLANGSITETELCFFAKYASESYYGAAYLELHIENVGSFSGESHNYFDALINLRKELEPLQIKILCFGARRDVWASGMQRDMGAGLTAYLLSAKAEGRKPEQSIFDYAPPETIGTVDEQRKYSENWANAKQPQKP